MNHFLFNICDTFWIKNRGLVVATDLKVDEAKAKGIRLKVGDVLEFRRSDGSRIISRIVGLEFLDPYLPNRSLVFLLSPEVTKEDLPIGTQAWSSA